LEDANRALDLGGDQSVTTQAVSGVLAFADGDYDTAVRRFRDAVELNDQTPGVLLYLSAAETARGDAAAADRWRDRAIALLDGSERRTATGSLLPRTTRRSSGSHTTCPNRRSPRGSSATG
jgi:hypothetical protein